MPIESNAQSRKHIEWLRLCAFNPLGFLQGKGGDTIIRGTSEQFFSSTGIGTTFELASIGGPSL